MKTLRSAICVALGVSLALRALAQSAPTPAQEQLREIFKELVEINTTDSAGSCTAAAEAMAARLKAGGLPAQDVQVIVPAGGPKNIFLPPGSVISRECAQLPPSRARQPNTVITSPTFIVTSFLQPVRTRTLGL